MGTLANRPNTLILLVGKDAASLRRIENLLADADDDGNPFQITCVESPQAAANRLGRGGIDAILWDHASMGAASLDSLVEFRAHTPTKPVLVLLKDSDDRVALEAIRKGAHDCLAFKGLLGDELARRIRFARERKRSDSQFHLAENIYRNVFENSSIAIIVGNRQGTVYSWNRYTEKLLGYTSEDLSLKSLGTLFGPADQSHVKIASMAEQGHSFETQMRRKDGEVIDVDVSIAVLKELDGSISGTITVIHDVTERRKAEDELKRSHEELKNTQLHLIQAAKMDSVGRLAAGVAHEVKNPLAAIKMGLDFLAKRVAASDGQVAMIVKEMDEAVKRANTVVRGLLDFSSTRDLNLKLVGLNSVVDLSLLLVRHDLETKQIQIQKEYSETLPQMNLDINKIEQVFINIFLNSVYAMKKGGALSIRTYSRAAMNGNGEVVVEVDDTGAGIPEDKLNRIFDPYFTTKPMGEGTGLGLTVSQKILELHGAQIRVANRKEGGVRATLAFQARNYEEKINGKYDKSTDSGTGRR